MSIILIDGAWCDGNFVTQSAPLLASVAQWIERRFPKPQVACSIHAGGTMKAWPTRADDLTHL